MVDIDWPRGDHRGMDGTIRIETFPWWHSPHRPMGLEVRGFIGERRVMRVWLRDTQELASILGHAERIHGRPVDFSWEMS